MPITMPRYKVSAPSVQTTFALADRIHTHISRAGSNLKIPNFMQFYRGCTFMRKLGHLNHVKDIQFIGEYQSGQSRQ